MLSNNHRIKIESRILNTIKIFFDNEGLTMNI